ncbi:hypothetical protein GCM10027598_11490 [Amycolatopsis oliviviridis]|uniref:Uncharacterized protein n=1 Tax=Amycolatopsis oliviviridis TaxID=1471590 RepID=A0ABQ3LW74_9PSEU|nr:hypothetical protein [Amycolatopsis oliviviridis]GHH26735.1 hypothetical protein GCM10017790_54640 [Amycolatopsis oliviviridis]
MDTPPGQDGQPFQQQPDAPPTVVSVSGPADPVVTSTSHDRPEPRRLVAAGLVALAMVLTLVGCFFPLFRSQHRTDFDRGQSFELLTVQSAWGSEFVQMGETFKQSAIPVGIPLVLAAVLLLAALLVSARAAYRRPNGLDRWLTTIAAVFLIGVVATIGMLGIGIGIGPSIETTTTVEAGMWALFAAVAASVGAAIMSHRVQADEVPMVGDPGLADMPTPKDGISITVLPPEPRPGPPDYSAFAPPPDPGAKERD